MGRAFANQGGLKGADSTIPGYRTSKARVCVTVAMMTTGYDCPDLLNLGFCRPVKSPTDYIQMKGRGTRLYDFTQNFTDQLVRDRVGPRPKEGFRIIDYFGVCEYFGEGGIYGGEPLDLPSEGGTGGSGGDGPGIPGQPYIRHGRDQTESITELDLGAHGEIIDRSVILEQREAANQALGEEFERYLEHHPVSDGFERENVQRLFEAYATDDATRAAIDSGEYGALGNAITIQQYGLVSLEHRQAIPDYIKNLNSEAA